MKIHRFPVTTSTNDEAIRRAKSGEDFEDGEAFIADRQTAGRGRMGRSWESPPGNLYVSFLLKPQVSIAKATELTLLAADVVCKVLAPLSPVPLTIKPPNDILVQGKKLAGILAESATLKDRPLWVVVGIGINLNSGDFSPELSEAATSLKKISGRTVDVSETASALIENFERAYRGFIDVARN